jgi:hypothetical protein
MGRDTVQALVTKCRFEVKLIVERYRLRVDLRASFPKVSTSVGRHGVGPK